MLTGRQRSILRSLGQTTPVSLILGKGGLTDSVAGQANVALARHELIKVRLPAGPREEREAIARDLAGRCGAEYAGGVGRTGLLYRPNPQLAPAERVDVGD